MTSAYFDDVSPTYIENWPGALCSLSIAQADVPMTLEEAAALGRNIIDFGDAFGAGPHNIDSLRERTRAAVSRFPFGAFIRLGSRSPKDSWAWHRAPSGPKILASD